MKSAIKPLLLASMALTPLLALSPAQAAPMCTTADPFVLDSTENFDIDADETGGVVSVCMAYDDGFGAGFTLDFSGTPVVSGTDPITGEPALILSDLEVLDPFSGGSFNFSYYDPFFSASPVISLDPAFDLVAFLWVVDGNGGSLEVLDLIIENEDLDSFALLELEFFSGPGFGELGGLLDDQCIDPFFDPNCQGEFDFTFVSFPAPFIENTQSGPQNPGPDVPAPGTIALLALGLLGFGRKASMGQR